MEPITLGEILEATGGTLLGGVQDLTRTVQSVDTDSRTITPDALFVPLAGDRFDGHAYIGQALEQGAAGTLTGHELGTTARTNFTSWCRTPCWRWATWRPGTEAAST